MNAFRVRHAKEHIIAHGIFTQPQTLTTYAHEDL